MLRYFLTAVMALICAGAVQADEGMWTLDHFPSEAVAKAYGFKPDAAWLEHAEHSAVRLAGGCSGSFVSPQGLVQTNHHCAHSCIEQLSTPQKDFVASGFYAARLEDEIKCPQIEINQLIDITNVTDRVQAAIKGLQGKAFTDARKTIEAKIAKECVGEQADALRCDVVELYQGGLYNLYKYRRYQDVRLVFAPEIGIAFFGGDPDNFEFPRYDLDVSYLRVYDQDRPLDTTRFHFKYAQTDARPGDLTFVLGHPGSTHRLDTVAQIETQRDVDLPRILLYLSEYRGQLIQFMKRGVEQRRIAEDTLFGVENSVKGLRGRFEALIDPAIIKARAKMEKAIAGKIKGAPFQRIAEAEIQYRNIRDRMFMIESNRGFASTLFTRAKGLVRYAVESKKPDGERLREYTDANFPSLRQNLLSKAPIYPELETMKLSFSLTKLREALGPDDPLVRKVFGHSSADQLAHALVDGSTMADLDARKALLDGGEAAIEASQDSMIRLVREIDPDMRAVRKIYEDDVQSVLERNSSVIDDALFATYGTSVYPDATFTLRLSYGAVKGYPEKGFEIDPITKMAGLFERANGPLAPDTTDDPFRLPQRWLDAKSALNPNQPFDFATTNDIIGGNSGSPVINSKSEVVGLIFDGNIESLGGDYGYDAAVNRAVAVAVGALREALIKVYHADRIAEELKG